MSGIGKCFSVSVVTFGLFLVGLGNVQAAEHGVSASDFVQQHGYVQFPDYAPKPRAGDKAWDFVVGDSRNFWSWSLAQMPPSDIEVPATCRAVGQHVYVFVADDLWGSDVDQADVDAVMEALEESTPAGSIDPTQGIVPNEYDVFGEVPDALDSDPKVFILLMELEQFGGTAFDGFFNAYNQYPDEDIMAQYGYHSNELEMVTVNATIRSVSSEITMGILAHEYQHLIHWGGDVNEVTWLNESCSEAAMTLNGYLTDDAWLADYMANTTAPLKEAEHVHYGACLLFGSYLYERYGAAFLTTLVAEPGHGDAGLLATLDAVGAGITLDELELDWATATIADSQGAEGERFSHPLFDLVTPAVKATVDSYPRDGLAGSLDPSGAAYVEVQKPAGAELDVLVQLNEGDVSLRAIWGQGQALDYADFEAGGEGLRIPFSSLPEATPSFLVIYGSGAARTTWGLSLDTVPGEEQPDAGDVDAGEEDAGEEDAGEQDAGELDAGGQDAGEVLDGGGDTTTTDDDSGCGCAAAGASSMLWFGLLGLALLVFRRREKDIL